MRSLGNPKIEKIVAQLLFFKAFFYFVYFVGMAWEVVPPLVET